PLGFAVSSVPISRALHLKSAVTLVAPDTLLINRDWVSDQPFTGCALVECDPAEPFAANALLVGDQLIHAAEFPRTRGRLESRGIRVHPVAAGELAKAEGGVTCCSLIVE